MAASSSGDPSCREQVAEVAAATPAPAAAPIHILRVTEQSIMGGEQTDVLHLLTHLDPARYTQAVCSAPAGPFVDEVRRLGIPHIAVTMHSKFDVIAIFRLRRIVREGHYDIVHLHGARAGLLGRIAARLAGAPLVVWTMHVFQPDVLQGPSRWQMPLYFLVERLLAWHFCDHIITVSEDLRQRTLALEHVPADKVTTIYSYVDLSAFSHPIDPVEKRRELGLPMDAPVVCTIGRLCAQKGLPDFLQAAALVHTEMAHVRFLVVGEGPLRSELEKMAARLGLDGFLTFTGHRSDVAAILCASDVFAIATLWEGFGKVNVEAMAAGKPLVSTHVGPIPEVVGNYGAALLVPPRDPPAFAEALLTILRALPTYARRGIEDRGRAHELFGETVLAHRTSALYERLLAARRVRRARAALPY